MARYYVNNNAQSNGDHEVHREGCSFLAIAKDTSYLGSYDDCRGAVKEATKTYSTANGCKFCSPDCHTT